MIRQLFGGSGGGGKGKTSFSASGAHAFTDLNDAPNSYVGQGGKVVVVKALETGLEFNTEAAIDRHDVKASAGDVTPNFLDSKVDAKTILVTADKLNSVYSYYFQKPVIGIYDNTISLPPAPFLGERYIAKVTANGWTINHLYDYNGVAWDDTPDIAGMVVMFSPGYSLYAVMYGYGAFAWFKLVNPDEITVTMPAPTGPLSVKTSSLTDSYIAAANIDGTAITPSMRTLGAGALQACAGNDARLSNDRTPLAHALAGSKHSADTITNLNTKLSDGSLITSKAAEIDALTAKAVPTTADELIIEDAADTFKKKKITIGNLPATAPAAHLIGGAVHTADTVANIQSKVSDGSLITSKPSEITALTEKASPVGLDVVLAESIANANAKRKIKLSNFLFPRYIFFADNMASPNNADWTLNALAPASPDSLNNALTIRQFDDTTRQGVGLSLRIPLNAVGFTISFVGRAQTAPGGAVNIDTALYCRKIRDNTAVSVWSLSTNGIFAIPLNTNFQYFSTTYLLSDFAILADDIVQFEFARAAESGNDTLSGNFNLLNIKITFV